MLRHSICEGHRFETRGWECEGGKNGKIGAYKKKQSRKWTISRWKN